MKELPYNKMVFYIDDKSNVYFGKKIHNHRNEEGDMLNIDTGWSSSASNFKGWTDTLNLNSVGKVIE